ncbi:MAG: NDP-sugar synthase [Actinobacteria bacterium]|nr:NDP-sugar synthase [Actinomycetota bacterium]
MSDQRTSPVRDALIVAGGRGTRLQPLTHDLPKPLLPFCGAPFLEGVIRRLAAAGVVRIRLVVGADTDPFEILRPAAHAHGVELDMVPEPEPLDTAGGVRSVADRLDRPFLVLNGDILTDVDYAAVGRRHVDVGADATMVLTEVEDTSSYGVAVRDGTRIVEFVEKPDPGSFSGPGAINAGTYVLEPHVLLAHPTGRLSFERDVFPGLLERGDVLEGFVWDGVWADLGTPDRYRAGHRLALSGALHWPPLDDVPARTDGLRIAADADVDPDATVVAPVLILGGSQVGSATTVGPATVLGRDVRVGRSAALEGAVLHDRVVVGDGVSAPGLVAGHGARVDAGARMGRDVVLGSAEVVGGTETVRDGASRPSAQD